MAPIISTLGVASPVKGIKNLHIALVTKNDTQGFTAETPVPYPGLNQLSPTLNTQEMTYAADGRTFSSSTVVSGVTLQANLAGTTPEFQKHILGYTTKDAGLLTKGTSGPDVVVLFEKEKDNGGVIFEKYATARFAPVLTGGQTASGNYQDAVVNAQVSAPVNGALGDVGHFSMDSDSDEFKALGLTIPEARALFFGDALWTGGKLISSLAFSPLAPSTNISLATKQEDTASIKATYSDASTKVLTSGEFSVDNTTPAVATYDSVAGKFNYLSVGSTTFTFTAGGKTLTHTVNITA